MDVVEIKFKDKQNWTSVSGIVTNWDDYSKKYKDERIQPHYVAPEVITDTWGGETYDVQHLNHKAYYFEIWIKESEVFDIQRIKSCSDIIITQFVTQSDGSIISKAYTLDLTKSDFLEITIERVEKTSSHKVTVIFRTERTIINKGDSILNTNDLKITTSEWQLVSETTSPVGTNIIAALTDTRIAAINTGVIQAYDYIANQWVAVGNSLSTAYTSETIAITSTDIDNIVIFVAGTDKLAKYVFDGTDWSLAGNAFTFSSTKGTPAIAKLDSTTIAIADGTDKKMETYEFDGTDWSQAGNSLSLTIAGTGSISISGLTSSTIAYTDSVNKAVRRYSWDGTDWTQDFTTSVAGVGDNVIITAMSTTTIAYIDDDNSELKMYADSGTAWGQVNATYTLAITGYNSITALDSENITAGVQDFLTQWELQSYTQLIDSTYISISSMASTRIATISWDSTIGVLKTLDLSSGTWSQTGNSLTTEHTTATQITIVALSSTSVVLFTDEGKLTTYSFDGTDWSKVGNTLALSAGEEPTVAKLTSSLIATYASAGSYDLETYSWDGTDWSQVGNSLGVTSGSNSSPCISGLSTTEIAYTDSVNKVIRRYSWDGTDWTQDFSTSVAVGSNVLLTALSSTEIAYIDASNQELKYYKILGSAWINYYSALALPSNELISTTTIDSLDIVIYDGASDVLYNYSIEDNNLNSFNNYISGFFSYYSDFDVLQYEKDVDDVNVEWDDGTEKTLQRIYKPGLEFLQYMSASDKDTFVSLFKQSSSFAINSTTITEVEYEQSLIAEDYYKVIVRGVISTTSSDFNSTYSNKGGSGTYNLRIIDSAAVTHNFYTESPPILISESPTIETSENQTGVKTPSKNISRVVKEVTFYLNESDAFDLKKRFELWGTTVTLDSANILESREVTPERIGVDSYEVKINCLMEATISY